MYCRHFCYLGKVTLLAVKISFLRVNTKCWCNIEHYDVTPLVEFLTHETLTAGVIKIMKILAGTNLTP